MDHEVGDLDCFIGMHSRLLVLVHLREQCADLHVRLAFVFKVLESQRRLALVIEKLLDSFTFKVF
jgi:hypothetical protein